MDLYLTFFHNISCFNVETYTLVGISSRPGISLAATRVILYDGVGQTGLDVDGAWLVERLQLEKEIIRGRRVTIKVEEKRENKNVERELKEKLLSVGTGEHREIVL